MEYRIIGTLPEGTTVRTEWMKPVDPADPDDEIRSSRAVFEKIRGWENVDIERREKGTEDVPAQ